MEVSVSVRLRPQMTPGALGALVEPGGTLVVGKKQFGGFVQTVVTGSDQSTAYEAIASPLMRQLHAGYSCTLLAYGQTGSGKTHTIFGPPGSLTEASLANVGSDGCPPR